VVPLDRRIDFLTLSGGKTVEIPFEVMVVFSSNRNPAEMLDDAFLRRVQTKIKIDAVTEEQFCEIFRRVAQERGLDCDMALAYDLAKLIREVIKEPLRPCYPRDLINQISWAAKYEGRPPHLDHAGIMHAVESYFVSP
jgi:SpoVK/Ycf46/Vps4 family AAA+-type ATPase